MNTVFKARQLGRWWIPVALGVAVLTVYLGLWLYARSSGLPRAAKTNKAAVSATNPQAASAGSVNAAVTAEASVPASLSDAGEYGENVYDYAKANDWRNAEAKISALKSAVKNAPTDAMNKGPAADRLDANVAALDLAILARDRQSAMRDANQVTLDVANMTTAYKLGVPVEVTRLDYYGRELEVWAQAEDANKLQTTAREMRRTWDSLRPSVEAHSATEAMKFDALVANVESAKTSADYAREAKPVLNEVDNLEKLFPLGRN